MQGTEAVSDACEINRKEDQRPALSEAIQSEVECSGIGADLNNLTEIPLDKNNSDITVDLGPRFHSSPTEDMPTPAPALPGACRDCGSLRRARRTPRSSSQCRCRAVAVRRRGYRPPPPAWRPAPSGAAAG